LLPAQTAKQRSSQILLGGHQDPHILNNRAGKDGKYLKRRSTVTAQFFMPLLV